MPGVTVLIHDQDVRDRAAPEAQARQGPRSADSACSSTSASAKGAATAARKSNCLSVRPGRNRVRAARPQIDQPSCNKDLSCLNGDCPSFLTIVPGERGAGAAPTRLSSDDLPLPQPRVGAEGFGVRLAGVGGTGVVTVAQTLAIAARIDGRHVAGFDQTGLAQKYGTVISDLRISSTPIAGANRLAFGRCDLYIACDLVAAAHPSSLEPLSPDRSIGVVSTASTPTAGQVVDVAATSTDVDALVELIERRVSHAVTLDAHEIAVKLFGSDQVANMVLVGAAYQVGALPLSIEAIEAAIELNGVSVQDNLQAVRRGRQAISGPTGLRAVLTAADPPPVRASVTRAERRLIERIGAAEGTELRRLIEVRVPDLVDYQSASYARRYVDLVARVRAAEEAVTGESAGPLSCEVARYLHKLMAYKDEYEVARLHLDPSFGAAIAGEFGPDARYSWQLQPPVLRALGVGKITVGPWFRHGFRALRAARRVRGTRLDPFAHTEVRRLERSLVREYEATIAEVLAGLSPHNHAIAVGIAELPDQVRGYEGVKLGNAERYHARLQDAQRRFAERLVASDPVAASVAAHSGSR